MNSWQCILINLCEDVYPLPEFKQEVAKKADQLAIRFFLCVIIVV